MAAIDLEVGLECSGRGWGQERPEMTDNFDSEMQEWEDQLQDIQKKIEELYNEVQARRGGNDISAHNQRNGSMSSCGLGHHGNNLFMPGHRSTNHPGDISAPHHHRNKCNHSVNGYSCPMSHQNGYSHQRSNGGSEIGDLLQDYLGKEKQMSRKNNGARHVHFSDTVKVSKTNPAHQDESRRRLEGQRVGREQFMGSFEETENRKNRVCTMRSSPCRDRSPNKESAGSKPPLGQRESPAAQHRSQLPVTAAESPSVDRKPFSGGVLGDKKSSSPSVLRKFEAMLQENEGKTLTESGVVAHQGAASETKCGTPSCQRRALGSAGVAGRVPVRVPNQKSQADCDMLTAETEPSQEWGSALDSGRQNYKDQRGCYSSAKGSQAGPHQTQRRSQVTGSPKIRPRANSMMDRESGQEKTRKAGIQHADSKMDHRATSSSPAPQRIQRGQELPGDDGLIELLDMLEIQHEYRTGSTVYRPEPQQMNSAESSPARPRKSFSRPARPANQRPPSRWAGRTPTARITAPSGPIYRPPSPMTRTPSPMTRTPSPATLHRPLITYSLQPETVIM